MSEINNGQEIEMKFTATIKKAENPKNVCEDCGFRLDFIGCMNRSLCPDDKLPGHNYFRGKVEKLEK